MEFETLPGPRGLPLVGNALAFDPKAVHLVLERWAAQYGRAFHVSRVGDPSAVRDIFAFTLYPTGLRVRLRERRPAPQDSC